MQRNTRNLASFVLALGATFALLLWLCGCASAPQIEYKTVEVKVPVVVPPPPLVIEPPPEIESLSADPNDWLEYLRAMTRDILNMWAYIELVTDRVEEYNAATQEVPAAPPTN